MKRTGMKKSLAGAVSAVLALSPLALPAWAAVDPPAGSGLITHLSENLVSDSGTAVRNLDYAAVDPGDSGHGLVTQVRYGAAAQTAVVQYPNETSYPVRGKMVSFDFNVYDNTIPHEVRLVNPDNRVVSEFTINYNGGGAQYKLDGSRVNAKLGVGSASTNEDAVLSNQVWHHMDIVFTDVGSDYYVDGGFVKTFASAQPDRGENTFTGFQFVTRVGNQADSATDESGLYLDNLKTQLYSEDSVFYGSAFLAEGGVTVEFSETPRPGADFSGVKLIQTQTEEEASIGTPVFGGSTLFIPVNGQLDSGVEYLVSLPQKPVGFTGKELYGDIYFTTPSASAGAEPETILSVDFEGFGSIPNTNQLYNSLYAADKGWYDSDGGGKRINIEDLSGAADPEDKSHGEVLFASSSETDAAKATELRWGILLENPLDVTQGEHTIEFDIKMLDSYFNRFVIQPFSATKEGLQAATDQQLVAAGYDGASKQMGAQPFQRTNYSTMVIMGDNETKQYTADNTDQPNQPYVGFRVGSNEVTLPTAYANATGTPSLSKESWHHVKLTVDGSQGGAYPKVSMSIDGGPPRTNSGDMSGEAASDYLKGIRFYLQPYNNTYNESKYDQTNVRKKVYLDNVTFTGPGSSASVQKVRIYDAEGEDYGPLSNQVPVTADRAEITLSEPVQNLNKISVSMNGDVNGAPSLSEDGRVITAPFEKMLQGNTKYTIRITGVGKEASASFTTTDKEEFLVYNLRVTDSQGTELQTGHIQKGTATVYATVVNATGQAKSPVVLGTVHNGLRMNRLNMEELSLEPWSKEEVSFTIEIADTADLTVKVMAWESFEAIRPLVDAVTY